MVQTHSIHKTIGLILAAGDGTRFDSRISKPYATILGWPMIQWVTHAMLKSSITDILWVVRQTDFKIAQGLQKHLVQTWSARIGILIQPEHPRGTGAALQAALPSIRWASGLNGGKVLISPADNPGLEFETIAELLNHSAPISLCALKMKNPSGYGRVKLDAAKNVIAIREEKDSTDEEKQIDLVFSGLMCGSSRLLESLSSQISPSLVTNELYLTQIFEIAAQSQYPVGCVIAPSRDDVTGVNNMDEYIRMEAVLQKRIIQDWIKKGVRMIEPRSVWIDKDVVIDPGVVIPPGVSLWGDVRIKKTDVLEPGEQRGQPRPVDWAMTIWG